MCLHRALAYTHTHTHPNMYPPPSHTQVSRLKRDLERVSEERDKAREEGWAAEQARQHLELELKVCVCVCVWRGGLCATGMLCV